MPPTMPTMPTRTMGLIRSLLKGKKYAVGRTGVACLRETLPPIG